MPQRPVPVSSSELVVVLDGFSARVKSTHTQVVIQTHIGSGNACNVKIGTYPVHLGVDPAREVQNHILWEPYISTFASQLLAQLDNIITTAVCRFLLFEC